MRHNHSRRRHGRRRLSVTAQKRYRRVSCYPMGTALIGLCSGQPAWASIDPGYRVKAQGNEGRLHGSPARFETNPRVRFRRVRPMPGPARTWKRQVLLNSARTTAGMARQYRPVVCRHLYQVAKRLTVARTSWPGVSGPSPPARAAIVGPDTPGHDAETPVADGQCQRDLVLQQTARIRMLSPMRNCHLARYRRAGARQPQTIAL
jgi:hypothetical protein